MFQILRAKKCMFSTGVFSKLVVICCTKYGPTQPILASFLCHLIWLQSTIRKNKLKVYQQAAVRGNSELCLLARSTLPNPG